MDQATNAAVMRAKNRKLIMNHIRIAPISRAELADTVQLTRASVTQIVDELIENGLVEAIQPTNEPSNVLGRKRIKLVLRRDARFAFGVCISRTECDVGLVDLYGELKVQQVIPVAGRSATDVIGDIVQVIRMQQAELHLETEQIIGIGVCTPGPVDYCTGMLRNPPHFAQWHGVRICEALQSQTGFPALLEKDTNARALEEQYYGIAQRLSSFMLVQIDDGVGSGVVVRNALYRGNGGFGSEIGHTSICYNGPQCSCGNRGCLENYIAIPQLLKDSPYSTWCMLAEHAEEPQAVEILDHAAEYLSAALINAVNLYDLEKIVLTGDVADPAEPLLIRINRRMNACMLSKATQQEPMVQSAVVVSPVRTGAMAILHAFFQERE